MAVENRVIVDGVEYRWTVTTAADLNPDGSISFGYRFDFDESVTVTAAAGGREVHFKTPMGTHLFRNGWWEGPRGVGARLIEDAIRIALRHQRPPRWHELTDREVLEALVGRVTPLEEELRTLGDALTALPATSDALVRSLLGIGCRYWRQDDAKEGDRVIAGWVAAHATELVGLQGALQGVLDHDLNLCDRRSAFAFLLDMCAHASVELGLDTSRIDERLAAHSPHDPLPWHVPASHVWWRPRRDSDDID